MFLFVWDIPDFRELLRLPFLHYCKRHKSPDLNETTAGRGLGCIFSSILAPVSSTLCQMYQLRSPISNSVAPEQMLKVSRPPPLPPRRWSQVNSRGRCCSWPGRWSYSLQERGRSCRWGRHTVHRGLVLGRPRWEMLCRCRVGDYPAEWCWHLTESGT